MQFHWASKMYSSTPPTENRVCLSQVGTLVRQVLPYHMHSTDPYSALSGPLYLCSIFELGLKGIIAKGNENGREGREVSVRF